MQTKISIIIVFFFAVFGSLYAQDGVWVESEGIVFGSNITPEAGKERAIENAMAEAVRKVVGVKVSEETFGTKFEKLDLKDKTKSQYDESFLITSRSTTCGVVTQKEIISESVEMDKKYNVPIYKAKIRAYVVREEGKPDPAFKVEVELNKDIFYDKGNPKANDLIEVYIKSTADCYLYLFCRMEDNQVIILFPNDDNKDNRFKGNGNKNQFMDIINSTVNIFGYALPEGKTKTTESLYLIATKDKIPFTSENLSLYGTFNAIDNYKTALMDILSWVVQIPADRRTSATVSYEIKKSNK